MSKNKTVRNVFFVVFCFFACISLARAESCSAAGQVQYKSSGSCGTSSRKCCNGGSWSDWDKDCPQCSESATSWASSDGGADTCPGGDSTKEYQCDGSFVGTCTDIKAEAYDKDMGSTSTFSFDPPSGYTRSYDCYDSDRAQNKKIAISYDQEYQMPTYSFANAYCQKEEVYDDLTGEPAGVKYIFSFYPKSGGYYTNEQIPECPDGVDGHYYGCNTLCNVPAGDNHGCKKEAKCYKLGSFLSEENCESWPVGDTTGSIHTCGIGAGGVKFKYNLKQCGFKYQKRTVTCCGK